MYVYIYIYILYFFVCLCFVCVLYIHTYIWAYIHTYMHTFAQLFHAQESMSDGATTTVPGVPEEMLPAYYNEMAGAIHSHLVLTYALHTKYDR